MPLRISRGKREEGSMSFLINFHINIHSLKFVLCALLDFIIFKAESYILLLLFVYFLVYFLYQVKTFKSLTGNFMQKTPLIKENSFN